MLRPEQIYLLALGLPVVPCNGGDSSSSNSQSSSSTTNNTSTTNTTNIDKRLVADAGAVGVSSDTSTVTVNVLDQGAVKQAIDLVAADNASAGDKMNALLEAGKALFAEAFKVLDKNTAIAAQVSTTIGSAYDVAQSSVSGARDQQKTLLIVGGVVLGIVALRYFKKGIA